MAPSARQAIKAIANAAPTICGGGAFVFAGREFDIGPVSYFHGGITEFDTRAGVSKGALVEAGGGEGVVGGVGGTVTTSGEGIETAGLLYVGVGVHTQVAGASVGIVGYTAGIGVYGEGSMFGRVVGGGGYLNVTSNAACNQASRR